MSKSIAQICREVIVKRLGQCSRCDHIKYCPSVGKELDCDLFQAVGTQHMSDIIDGNIICLDNGD